MNAEKRPPVPAIGRRRPFGVLMSGDLAFFDPRDRFTGSRPLRTAVLLDRSGSRAHFRTDCRILTRGTNGIRLARPWWALYTPRVDRILNVRYFLIAPPANQQRHGGKRTRCEPGAEKSWRVRVPSF